MNCIESFITCALRAPEKPALWTAKEGTTSYGELYCNAASVQSVALSAGVEKGDYALIFGEPNSSLYAAAVGLLGIGCSIIFIEPWMALSEIEQIIRETNPKIYLTNALGRLWGLRIKAVRNIPVWVSHRKVKQAACEKPVVAVPLPETHVGFITFTTGTTGRSKGVVRTHGVLRNQCAVLSKHLPLQGDCDLCVLPNFVLLNLSQGKSSVYVSGDSSRKVFQKIPKELEPSSVCCGPGFLQKLIENARYFPQLRSFHIGGALAECSLYERGFAMWPNASWTQIYGSSEAEPVAMANAKDVVEKCRERSLHQTLFLGKPVDEIALSFHEGLLWVSGSHVSPFYFGEHEANRTHKKKDETGRRWHSMGDRISSDALGLWYQGRGGEPLDDFLLEQEISSFLETNNVLVVNRNYLLGSGVIEKKDALLAQFPAIKEVIECRVYRDRRHRARIDRDKTIKKGAPWVVGSHT